MKTLLRVTFLIVIAVSIAWSVPSDTLTVDPTHSAITFSIRHIVSRVQGRFTEFKGVVYYDEKHPEHSFVDMEVKASSINTDNSNRDKHLRSSDFFAVDSFPTLIFKSTKAVKTDQGLSLDGSITIHGISKDLTVPVEILGVSEMKDRTVAGFSTSFTVNRKDFDIVWNRTLDNGGLLLGDDVKVTINVEAKITKEP